MSDKKLDNVSDNSGLLPYGSNVGAPSIQSTNIEHWKEPRIDKLNKSFKDKYEKLKQEYQNLMEEYTWNDIVYNSKFSFEPVVGNVYHLYEDSFGNLITTITREEFEKNVGNKRFSIALPSGDVTKIYNTYDDVKIGDVVCFFNSMDLLEIALLGQAANKLAIKKSVLSKYKIDRIIVEIYD